MYWYDSMKILVQCHAGTQADEFGERLASLLSKFSHDLVWPLGHWSVLSYLRAALGEHPIRVLQLYSLSLYLAPFKFAIMHLH